MEVTALALGTLLVLAGLVAAASAFLSSGAHAAVSGPAFEWRRHVPMVGPAVVAFVLVVVATGWVLPAAMVAVVVWWVVRLFVERDRNAAGDLARVEALATWTEQLRDVLLAGDQPVGAIQATVATCPEVIRPQVRALAARLGRQSEQLVLRQWADDIDDPIADLVAAGLLVALGKGGKAEAVLSSLAAQARQQADRRKVLEAERAPARREVWWVTGLMTVQLVAGLLFARSDYLAPYRSVTGQVVLTVMLGVFLALVVYVQKLSRFPRPARFLTVRAWR